MKKVLILAAVLAGVVYLKMSSSVTQGDLVGRWSATDRPYHVVFSADGTCQIATIGSPRNCTYNLNGSSLAIRIDRGREITAHAEMRGDKLELYSDSTYFLFARE